MTKSPGIGLETARVLALRGATVIVVARNQKKADEAVNEIKHLHAGNYFYF